jgi:virginiamycin B lyase
VRIEEFKDLPTGYSGAYFPTALTAPGKVLWVAGDIDQDFGASAAVRINTSGERTNALYYQNYASPAFEGIAVGSDGALWLTDWGDEAIVRITRHGGSETFPVQNSALSDIVAGPDGALWFAEVGAVGRITTDGKITIYPAAKQRPDLAFAGIEDITVGPDKALWFTQMSANAIFRTTTSGSLKEFTKGISSNAGLTSIATGPDGALWFTEAATGRIGRITTRGKVTEYSKGITPPERPAGIAAGPDNAMWFTESEEPSSYYYSAAKIGRITMSGKIAEYTVPTSTSDPTAIVAGPDGNMWFVEASADQMGRVDL